MNKILLVIRREYATRIRKTSFWVITLLVPLLIGALYAIPLLIASKPLEHAHVLVVDETGLFNHAFQSTKQISYHDAGSLDYAKEQLQCHDSLNAIVFIPARETTIPNDAFLYYYSDMPSPRVQADVENQLQNILRNNILLDVHGISAEDYDLITHTRIKLHTNDIETGRDEFLPVKIGIGTVLAMLIFMAVFIFGSQVMRGVMEEKGNRIVEVIICSVRPFQLMMGKVIGIALVGLTQFALWVALSAVALTGITLANSDLLERASQQQEIKEIATKGNEALAQMEALQTYQAVPANVQGLTAINYPLIVTLFLCYFLLGYLLYATLFAAVGAITDNDTDTQQFTLPLTLPMIAVVVLLPTMINEPSGSVAQWLSIIPFTSPIAMMFRIPFGVSVGEVALSLGLLIITFLGCVWIASKIYRWGILRYGSKTHYKDLFKALRHN